MAEERKLEGWLLKQGEGAFGKGYKKRWFSQTGTCLYYYKQRSDSENAGFINLAEAISCHATEGAKGKFQFQINTPRRIWHLEAETEDAMHYWVEGIKAEFAKIKEQDESGASMDRRSVRLETSENRIRDLEARETILKKGLGLACRKLGVSVDQVLSEVEGGGSAASQLASEVTQELGEGASSSSASSPKKAEADAKESGESGGGGGGKKDKRFKAKVLYDYTAQQDYEMTIHTGEVIMVLSKHGNGWWLGASAEGKQGYFPGSYCEPVASS
eukprot:TRINITY_DN988_c0_g1_i1.p1 TRINITY_DN988_c0_g1~~TRINITY_DN988_c0_g1_i1.p1  ORF type:complete len:283 (-),score=111.64 TRINITY_DN988_c0_g1_i1:477-1295(-)